MYHSTTTMGGEREESPIDDIKERGKKHPTRRGKEAPDDNEEERT